MKNFTLSLIKTEDNSLLLQGSCPGKELEYYDLDGEGGKATKISFAPWNQEIEEVEGVLTAQYDTEETDSFWEALETVITSAKAHKKIPLSEDEINEAISDLGETGNWKFVENELHTRREENSDWLFVGIVPDLEEAKEQIEQILS